MKIDLFRLLKDVHNALLINNTNDVDHEIVGVKIEGMGGV